MHHKHNDWQLRKSHKLTTLDSWWLVKTIWRLAHDKLLMRTKEKSHCRKTIYSNDTHQKKKKQLQNFVRAKT